MMDPFVGKLTGKLVPFDPVSEPDGSTPYTLAQIKAAFWAVFDEVHTITNHKGEYVERSYTEGEWGEFLEELEKAKGENDAKVPSVPATQPAPVGDRGGLL